MKTFVAQKGTAQDLEPGDFVDRALLVQWRGRRGGRYYLPGFTAERSVQRVEWRDWAAGLLLVWFTGLDQPVTMHEQQPVEYRRPEEGE